MKKYTEQDMAKLISEVETEFGDYLAKAQKDKEDLKKSEVSVEAVKQEAKTEAPAPTEDLSYDAEDIKELENLYGSMAKAEAEAHYKSIKKVMFGDKEEVKEVEVKKSEEPNKEDSEKLAKSEKEKDELKKANEELKKNLEAATNAITKIVGKFAIPQRKAVTSEAAFVKKNESEEKIVGVDTSKLTKKEINARLSDKIRNGKLTKTEHDLVVDFCDSKITVESIKHLL
jgi:hypothetical protein